MDNLQLDKAEFNGAAATDSVANSGVLGGMGGSAGVTCVACKADLREAYFQLNGTVLCGTCSDSFRQHHTGPGSRLGRFAKAILLGIGAATVGSIAYYAIRAITGYEIGLISIFVGILVGKAVRKGSGNRGGWRYQVLAAVLTYVSIASTYIPPAISAYREQRHKTMQTMASKIEQKPATQTASTDTPPAFGDATSSQPSVPTSTNSTAASKHPGGRRHGTFLDGLPAPIQFVGAVVFLCGLALSIPFLAGADNLIGLLIIGFGVWKAWQLNQKTPMEITGPHAINTTFPN